MSNREKSYVRPLIKSFGLDCKPPIASRPAPHHSSENLHRIQPRSDASGDRTLQRYDPPPFFCSPPHATIRSSVSNDNSPLFPGSLSLDTLRELATTTDDVLLLEVCDKCRQNVADGIQHPSIWTLQRDIPTEYLKTIKEITSNTALGKKRTSKDDCKLQ